MYILYNTFFLYLLLKKEIKVVEYLKNKYRNFIPTY